MAKEKFVPIEIKVNEKEVLKIAERAQKLLKEQFGVDVTSVSGIPTITYAFISSAMSFVNERKSQDGEYKLNIMELFDLGVSYRAAEEGEKDGNFTPFMIPGQEFKLLIKDDSSTEE